MVQAIGGSSNNGSQSQDNKNVYTVKSGDTLSGIAERNRVGLNDVIKANPQIKNPNMIFPGQQVTIPNGRQIGNLAGIPVSKAQPPKEGPGSYKVRSGDTLSGIAQRNNISLNNLIAANRQVKNPNMIFVGQSLSIPGGANGGMGGGMGAVRPRRSGGAASEGAGGANGAAPVSKPVAGDTKSGVTLQQLKAIMPNLSNAKAQQYLPYLNSAMKEFKINTPERKAAFLAQLAHESVQLRYFEEIASGRAYEGRRDLGNTQPGDGERFKGRGPIQLTGRANYRTTGAALGLNLEGNPRLAAEPSVGFRVAGYFWQSRGLNSLADSRSFDAITRRVNGGFNGKASRDAYYRRALNVLGA